MSLTKYKSIKSEEKRRETMDLIEKAKEYYASLDNEQLEDAQVCWMHVPKELSIIRLEMIKRGLLD